MQSPESSDDMTANEARGTMRRVDMDFPLCFEATDTNDTEEEI